MRYILEWNQGRFPSDDLDEILNHEMFQSGTVFEWINFGWVAI